MFEQLGLYIREEKVRKQIQLHLAATSVKAITSACWTDADKPANNKLISLFQAY
jgi:hypothetical protein